jgi:hypothetical protein
MNERASSLTCFYQVDLVMPKGPGSAYLFGFCGERPDPPMSPQNAEQDISQSHNLLPKGPHGSGLAWIAIDKH